MSDKVKNIVAYFMKKPSFVMYLNRLRSNIYQPIISLDAKVIESKEPIPYANRMDKPLKEVTKGYKWGDLFDCAWFNFTGVLLEDLTSDMVAIINTGGEGCVWDDDGVVQGITNVMSPEDVFQTIKGKRIVSADKLGIKDKKVDFWVEVGNNGLGGKSSGMSKLKRADICHSRQDIFGLYYDFMALYFNIISVEEKDKDYLSILEALKNAKKASGNLSIEEVAKAREILAVELSQETKDEFTVIATGHGHLDLAWLWPIRETKRKAERTYSNALVNIDKYDDYIYGSSQPQQFEWMKETRPNLYNKIKQAVASGSIEPQGGMWVEPDTNITGGESLIRQFYYGKKFFREEFGKEIGILWVPDVFGYTAALPQIMKKCGVDNFLTIKLSWNTVNKFPYHSFNWEGLDNSNILVHMPPLGTYNASGFPFALRKTKNNYAENKIANVAHMPFGVGDGGAGPGEFHINMLSRQRGMSNLPKLEFGTSVTFFDRLSVFKDKLPNYKGELYLEKHQGTFTTQSRTKYNNRLMERLLHNVEWLYSLLNLEGVEYPRTEIDKIWKEVLLYQFHDILPGSSIQRVYDELEVSYKKLEEKLLKLQQAAFIKLTKPNAEATVVNTIDFARSGNVKVQDSWYNYNAKPFSSAIMTKANEEQAKLAYTDNSIENEHLRVVFNDLGEIIKIFDKKSNYNCVKSAFNSLHVYKDRRVHYNAWDIDIKYTKKKPSRFKPYATKTYIDGMVVVRETQYKYNKSILIQEVKLYSDSKMVVFDTIADWQEKHKMLRADFYPHHFGDKVKCDIQFGNIDRSTKTETKIDYAQFEIPAHKWVDVFERNYGVALINNCKYGHRVKDGLISLNLLRSPVWPDPTADRGKQKFSYAIYPHKESVFRSELVKLAYEFNNPIMVTNGVRIDNLFDLQAECVMIESIMTTDDNNLAVRLYEYEGKDTIVELNANFKYNKAYETNMIFQGETECKLDSLYFTPYEIKTIVFNVNKEK